MLVERGIDVDHATIYRWVQYYAPKIYQNPTYSKAITALKADGKYPIELEHRQIKYLNNIIESEHGKLKRLIKPTLGFKSMQTAYATIKGFEIMRMFKREDLIYVWSRRAG